MGILETVILDGIKKQNFSPKQLTSLFGWYRSDKGVTLNGSTVSAWADQSGLGNHLTQTIAAQQPTFNVTDNQFNNLPSITFDNTSSTYLKTTSGISLTTFTIFMVCRMTTDGYFFSHLASSGEYCYTATNPAYYVKKSSPMSRIASKGLATSLTSAVPKSFRFEYEGTFASLLIYSNNSLVTLSDNSIQDPGSSSGFIISFKIFSDGVSDFTSGKIAEMIICKPNCTTQEKINVENYLKTRYNLY